MALDHALPPTGGWGFGVDRMTMYVPLAAPRKRCVCFARSRRFIHPALRLRMHLPPHFTASLHRVTSPRHGLRIVGTHARTQLRYLTNTNSIKEVLLFPAMRRQETTEGGDGANTHASFQLGSLDLTTSAGLAAIEKRLQYQPYILGHHPTTADAYIYDIIRAAAARCVKREVGGGGGGGKERGERADMQVQVRVCRCRRAAVWLGSPFCYGRRLCGFTFKFESTLRAHARVAVAARVRAQRVHSSVVQVRVL